MRYFDDNGNVTPEGVAFNEASAEVRRLHYEVLDALKDVVRLAPGSRERAEAQANHRRLSDLAGDAQLRLNRAAANVGVHWAAQLGGQP